MFRCSQRRDRDKLNITSHFIGKMKTTIFNQGKAET